VPLAFAALGVSPALSAGGAAGISLSPAIVEHAAVVGSVGSVTIRNGTSGPVATTVTAHPWIQAEDGATVPNQRVTLSTVRPSIASFALASGSSRVVSIALLRTPKGGSLYGNIDVTAVPKQKHANTVTIGYRLVAALRLDPRHAVYGARAGGTFVSGTHASGEVALAVTNTGNTIAPIGGSVRVKGARGGETGVIAAVRVLPGATVRIPVLALAGALPAGSYDLSASLSESGRHLVSAKGEFKLR
jgi:hypothetical protein